MNSSAPNSDVASVGADATYVAAMETDAKDVAPEDAVSEVDEQKLKYHPDQWSPLNPTGKKCYSRDFLIQLRKCPAAQQKLLEIAVDIPDIILTAAEAQIQTEPSVCSGCAQSGMNLIPPKGRMQKSNAMPSQHEVTNFEFLQPDVRLHNAEEARMTVTPPFLRYSMSNDSKSGTAVARPTTVLYTVPNPGGSMPQMFVYPGQQAMMPPPMQYQQYSGARMPANSTQNLMGHSIGQPMGQPMQQDAGSDAATPQYQQQQQQQLPRSPFIPAVAAATIQPNYRPELVRPPVTQMPQQQQVSQAAVPPQMATAKVARKLVTCEEWLAQAKSNQRAGTKRISKAIPIIDPKTEQEIQFKSDESKFIYDPECSQQLKPKRQTMPKMLTSKPPSYIKRK